MIAPADIVGAFNTATAAVVGAEATATAAVAGAAQTAAAAVTNVAADAGDKIKGESARSRAARDIALTFFLMAQTASAMLGKRSEDSLAVTEGLYGVRVYGCK